MISYIDNDEISQEALWVLCNFCLTTNINYLRLIIDKGLIELFCKFLDMSTSLKKVLLVLEALK